MGIEDAGWLYYELALNEVLFPIGISDIDGLIIMGSSGRMYVFGMGYSLCGETPEQAIESFTLGFQSTEVNISTTDIKLADKAQLIHKAMDKAEKNKQI